jgi:hypothetical protein
VLDSLALLLLPYYNLATTFSKDKATILAEHSPHKMSINLEEGKEPPYSLLYSLLAIEALML